MNKENLFEEINEVVVQSDLKNIESQKITGLLDKIEEHFEQLQKERDELKGAIEYYCNVLDEATSKTWRNKPDHVAEKMINALNKTK